MSVCRQAEEGKKENERCQCTGQCLCCVHAVSTVQGVSSYTLARLETLLRRSQSSFIVRTFQVSKSKFLCERLRARSIRMFREEICSIVLRVHSTHRQTVSRINCCNAKHRISICLNPPGPLRCRMCRAEIGIHFETN